MANGIINLVLKSTSIGSGFEDVRKQTRDLITDTNGLGKAAQKMGGAFGNAGNLVGQLFANILKGGIWGIMAAGVNLVIDQWKKHKEAVEKSLETERKAFDERVAKVEQYTQAMKRADETAARANSHIDALKAEREEIARNIKATNELERQRRIAAGENAETVNADIDSRNVSNDRFAKASAAADMEKKAENDLAAAREKAKLSESAVNKLLADRAKLISDIHKRAQAVWADEHKFAANAGYRLKTSEEKSYMSGRGDKDYDEKLKQLADLEKKIAEKKHEQVKASDALADAATKHTAALERVKSVEAENHAAALKDANERAAAEKAAEDARLEAVAKNLEEARAAKEKRMQDAADREADFQRQLDKELEEARIKAERKENEQKLENMKKAHAEQMKLLDEQIAKAKSEAAVWEQNAQRTRDFVRNNGGGFAAWNAQQNDEAREKAHGDRKQANAVAVAQAEFDRLSEEDSRRGRHMSPARRKRMERLRQFLDENNPNGNAAKRKADELEKKRKALEEQAQKDIGEIRKLLNGAVQL